MKTEDLSKMTSAAVMTLAMTLAAAWPAFINATADGSKVSPKIDTPRLVSAGVEMRLKKAGDREFKEGDEPVFELVAVNTTDQPTVVMVESLMNSTPKPLPRTRTPAMPIALWKEPHTLSLGPRETQTILEPTLARLPANSRIDVYLRQRNAAPNTRAELVSMFSFSTVADPPAVQ